MSSIPANVPAESDKTTLPVQSRFKSITVTILLQSSHRLGGVALLATLGTWALMYLIKDFHVPLAITAAAANLGLCCGLTARMLTRPGQPARCEANGVCIFNLVFFVLALHLMLFARLDVIRSAASQFFTPSPQTAPHG